MEQFDVGPECLLQGHLEYNNKCLKLWFAVKGVWIIEMV